MRRRLHNLLVAFRYQSHSGRGMRGLQEHHIAALIKDLAPFIEREIRDAVNSSNDDLESIGWLGGDDS